MRRTLLFAAVSIVFLFFAVAGSKGQRLNLTGELDFRMWFDNREYKSELTPDMTLFGLMVTPELGLKWEDHSVRFGTNITVDFGARRNKRDPEFIAYYNYNGEKFRAYAGVFPRRRAMGDYSSLFFSDSVRYYDSNMEGALFQYAGRRGFVELGCDWLSMISDSDREKFMLFSSGRLYTDNRKFFAGYYASMFHHSVSYTEEGVTDNLLFYPYLGMRLSNGDPCELKFLTVKAGWVQGMQRDRIHEDKFVHPGGFQAEVNVEAWKLGIHNTLYCGDNLMPYYDRYGPGLYMGDAFYRTRDDIYNRLELYWNAVRTEGMDLRVSSVHHYDGKKWNWQQLITFSFNLNENSKWW